MVELHIFSQIPDTTNAIKVFPNRITLRIILRPVRLEICQLPARDAEIVAGSFLHSGQMDRRKNVREPVFAVSCFLPNSSYGHRTSQAQFGYRFSSCHQISPLLNAAKPEKELPMLHQRRHSFRI